MTVFVLNARDVSADSGRAKRHVPWRGIFSSFLIHGMVAALALSHSPSVVDPGEPIFVDVVFEGAEADQSLNDGRKVSTPEDASVPDEAAEARAPSSVDNASKQQEPTTEPASVALLSVVDVPRKPSTQPNTQGPETVDRVEQKSDLAADESALEHTEMTAKAGATVPSKTGSANASYHAANSSDEGAPQIAGATPAGSNLRPEYPPRAVRNGIEGRVLLTVIVAASGNVRTVNVERSSGYGMLDRAAVRAVRKWRFRPASRFGVPIEDEISLPVVFRLEDG